MPELLFLPKGVVSLSQNYSFYLCRSIYQDDKHDAVNRAALLNANFVFGYINEIQFEIGATVTSLRTFPTPPWDISSAGVH